MRTTLIARTRSYALALLCGWFGSVAVAAVEPNLYHVRAEMASLQAFERCYRDAGIEVAGSPTAEVRLASSELLADDLGNHLTGKTTFGKGVWGKKVAPVSLADAALVEIYAFNGGGAALVNGRPVAFTNATHLTGWSVATVEPALLQRAPVEVVFTNGFTLAHDSDRRPALHSYLSTNAGARWIPAPGGEFLVHFRAQRHPAQGVITSEAIDLANPAGTNGICPLLTVREIRLASRAATPRRTSVQLEARSGATPQPDSSWTPWRKTPAPARYLQWRAVLATRDRRVTPVLSAVIVEADTVLEVDPGQQGLVCLAADKPRMVRSSYPYTFQRPSANLERLRREWKLDEVIAPGTNEFDKLILLRNWVRRQWVCNDAGSGIRTWNAIEILSAPPNMHGMCVHFATAFAQCALALGFNARQVILSGHFVADIWSEQYQKWVLMDVEAVHAEGFTRYGTAHYIDAANGVPLDVLELHTAQQAAWRAGRALVDDVVQQYTVDTNQLIHTVLQKKRTPAEIGTFRAFAFPLRNNFLDQLEPWEAFHGQDHYHSDAYLWWQGQPPMGCQREYSLQTRRAGDVRWTVNQAALTLTATRDPARLRMTVDTVTPNFKTFLYRCNGGEWRVVGESSEAVDVRQAAFEWPLAAGTNILEVKTVNAFGREGPASRVRVARQP